MVPTYTLIVILGGLFKHGLFVSLFDAPFEFIYVLRLCICVARLFLPFSNVICTTPDCFYGNMPYSPKVNCHDSERYKENKGGKCVCRGKEKQEEKRSTM
jgi:hypothetical protein